MIGSSYGWLITADERSELHLANPVTAQQISLPSVNTIDKAKPVFDDTGAFHKYEYSWYDGEKVYESPSILALDMLREYLFLKAILSSDPSTGNYIVAHMHNPYSRLSFARPGDDMISGPGCHHTHYEDCIFKDGLLYALTKLGEIQAFDLNGPSVTHRIVLE